MIRPTRHKMAVVRYQHVPGVGQISRRNFVTVCHSGPVLRQERRFGLDIREGANHC